MTDLLPDTEQFDFNRQRLQQEATMGIHMLMRWQQCTKSELADRLGGRTKRPLVSKFLSGTHNFRLSTLADLYAVLGGSLHFRIGDDLMHFELPRDERRCVQESHWEMLPDISIGTNVNIAFVGHEPTSDSGEYCDGQETTCIAS